MKIVHDMDISGTWDLRKEASWEGDFWRPEIWSVKAQ